MFINNQQRAVINYLLGNSEEPSSGNCGDGAGGFKPGNTCSRHSGGSLASSRERKKDILSSLSIGEKHGAGAYVRLPDLKNGKVQVYAGPFLDEADALAFRMMHIPNETNLYGISIMSKRDVRYLAQEAGEQRDVSEVKMLLPGEVKVSTAATATWKEHGTKVDSALVGRLKEIAREHYKGSKPVDLSKLDKE